ncbi:hypothetical protein IEO21_01655 [Rhodonia placenta]|uniref:Uncharacterized protein n=1 Tax=Rhodonia placenta TaxID=104341 RepID=A0A8H7P9B0_9APHY|nr:hypothetical protein IEO21_01655 [Postia placenta]
MIPDLVIVEVNDEPVAVNVEVYGTGTGTTVTWGSFQLRSLHQRIAKDRVLSRQLPSMKCVIESTFEQKAGLNEVTGLNEGVKLKKEARLKQEARLSEEMGLKNEAGLKQEMGLKEARLNEEMVLKKEEARLNEEAELNAEMGLKKEARLNEGMVLKKEEARLKPRLKPRLSPRLKEEAGLKEEEARLKEEMGLEARLEAGIWSPSRELGCLRIDNVMNQNLAAGNCQIHPAIRLSCLKHRQSPRRTPYPLLKCRRRIRRHRQNRIIWRAVGRMYRRNG